MTLGRILYEDYKKNLCVDTYSIYYDAFDKTSNTEEIHSIIRCIDEKYKILLYYEPDSNDNALLDSIKIGDKSISIQSYEISNRLVDKYKERHLNNLFTITLYFRHNTLCNYLNNPNPYEYKLHHYIQFFDIMDTIRDEVYFHYGMLLLKKQCYIESGKYTIFFNPVKVEHLNIEPNTMDFFKKDDANKTLLIYMSGGIGDNIMYSRFIRRICETNNKVIYLVYDNLFWIYSHIYKDIDNLTVIPFHYRDTIPHFDYHMNVSCLYNVLQLDYNDIYIEYFPLLPSYPMDICLEKPSIIINWKGCTNNSHEQYNRGINLDLCIPLFKLTHIQWISITKDITDKERCILNEHNVQHLSLDQNESFRYSTTLMKEVSSVITTDTSLAHMCGTLGVKCYTLLTAGCDWRWTHNNTTHWYPHMNLIRQTLPFNWTNVIDELITILNNNIITNE